MDQGVNGHLNFLDVNATRCGNSFSSNVYRKKTFTGLGLNYLPFVTHLYKINSNKTLVCTAFNICRSWSPFDVEIIRVRAYFTYFFSLL